MDLEFPEIVAPAEAPAQPLSAATAQAAELVDTAAVSDGKVLVNYSRTEAALANLRERYTGATFDLTTTKGDKAARAARQELMTLRTSLEKKRLELKRPAIEFGKRIDEEAARITSEIKALEQPIDAQILADEQRRREEAAERKRLDDERKARHTAAIAKIAAMLSGAEEKSAERLAKGVEIVEGMVLQGFEEYQQEAEATRSRVRLALRALHEKAVAREAEAARIAQVAVEQAEAARLLAEERAQLARERAELEALRAAAAPKPVEQPPEPHAPAQEPVATVQPLQAEVAAEPKQVATSQPDTRPPLTTGAVGDRLGFTVKADFLEQLGFTPAQRPEGSKSGTFWHAADYPRICDALVAHINSVREAA